MTNNCELSNNDAIWVELSIAFLGAILLAGFFYWRESSQRKKTDKLIEKQWEIIEGQTLFHDEQINITLKEAIATTDKIKHLLDSILRVSAMLKKDPTNSSLLIDFNDYVFSTMSRYDDLQNLLSRYATMFDARMYLLLYTECGRALSILTRMKEDKDVQVISRLKMSIFDISFNLKKIQKS